MVQTQHETHREPQPAPQPAPNGPDGSADQTAWVAECAAVKCRTDAGEVWAYSGGRVFTIPALPGFATMPANTRRLVAMMTMQHIPTRVGQTASGDLSQEAAKAIADPASYFSIIKDKDAFESAYTDGIAELVDKAKNWTDLSKLSAEDKKARAVLIAASAEKPANREKYFDAMVKASIEAGRNVVGKEKTRKVKAASDGGLDL